MHECSFYEASHILAASALIGKDKAPSQHLCKCGCLGVSHIRVFPMESVGWRPHYRKKAATLSQNSHDECDNANRPAQWCELGESVSEMEENSPDVCGCSQRQLLEGLGGQEVIPRGTFVRVFQR